MAQDDMRRQEREAATKCGLGSCPVCCATIGGVHMMMLDAGFTATQIHTEHLKGYPSWGELLKRAI